MSLRRDRKHERPNKNTVVRRLAKARMYFYDNKVSISVEEMYQHFKARMMEESKAEAI